jgi:phage tail tape-measure protein
MTSSKPLSVVGEEVGELVGGMIGGKVGGMIGEFVGMEIGGLVRMELQSNPASDAYKLPLHISL